MVVHNYISLCNNYVGHSTAPPTTDVSQLPDKARGFLRGVQSHLVELESNVNQLSSDLQAERHKVQEMSKECASYRDVVAARTTANSVSVSFMLVSFDPTCSNCLFSLNIHDRL